MNKIFYAPVDGYVEDIKTLNDGVFSEGLLGWGVYIKPEKNDFYNISEQTKIAQIFETKHAIFFEIEGINTPVLMHIGIDTVNMKGEPFTLHCKEGDTLKKTDQVVSVDLASITTAGFQTTTPIVFDCGTDFDIKILADKKTVKRGEPLFEISLKADAKKTDTSLTKPIQYKGKYEELATEIYRLVGSNANFKSYRNCMTRLRFVIKDKSIVNEAELKKLVIVKGINWSGDELQLIIGGEVYKVKEALDRYINNKDSFETKVTTEKNGWTAFVNFIKGVVLPLIPVMMAASILQAIYTILLYTNISIFQEIVIDYGKGLYLSSYNWFNVMFYMTAYAGTHFIGFFFFYNTVKYLKGNTVVGCLIGLILIAPYLMNIGTVPSSNPNLLEWFSFKIGNLQSSIGIKAYPTSVIPMVVGALVYVLLDNWIKTWMPTSIDVVFRHALAVLLTTSAVFMVLGNVLGFVEVLVGIVIEQLKWIPWGISTALFAIFWQPLVLTGTHAAIWNALAIPAINDPTVAIPMLFGTVFGVFGQFGAAIGVAIKTKNANLRASAIGALPAAVFGVTEPLIFGVTLRSGLPFILGCLGSGIGALVYAGPFNGDWFMPNAQGIFSFLSVGGSQFSAGVTQYIGWGIGLALAVSAGTLLTIIFFNERPNELKGTKKINKAILNTISKLTNTKVESLKKEYQTELDELVKYVDLNLMGHVKEFEANVKNSIKYAVKLNHVVGRMDARKEKYALLSNKAYQHEKMEVMVRFNQKYIELENNEAIKSLTNQHLSSQVLMNETLSQLQKIQQGYMELVEKLVQKIVKEQKISELELFKNNYFNTIHSLDIAYEVTDKNLKVYNNKVTKNYMKEVKVK